MKELQTFYIPKLTSLDNLKQSLLFHTIKNDLYIPVTDKIITLSGDAF